jgi:tetratricopeptide (TPR) repeat protein
MADDTRNPETPEPGPEAPGPSQETPEGGPPAGRLDPGAGAELYTAAAADGGIDLSGLDAGSGETLPIPPPPAPLPAAPDFISGPDPGPDPGSVSVDDFPKDNQAGAAAAQAESQREAAREARAAEMKRLTQPNQTAAFGFVKTFFLWLWKHFKAIPPLDDIFDQVVFSIGMQRKPGSMMRRAGNLAMQGRLHEAVKWYRDILALRPLTVAAYDGLGRAYLRLGLVEESDREFTIAENLERLLNNRDDLEAASALALAFLDRRQAKVSVSLIEPVLISHFYTPTNSELLKTMGRVYQELRSNRKLYQVYAAGLAQHPEDNEYYILKGEAEKKLGNTIEGDRLIKWGRLLKKLKDDPDDPNVKMTMGEICLKEHKEEEGLKFLRDAAALTPDNTGLRWRLYNLYMKRGDQDEALKYFLEIVA